MPDVRELFETTTRDLRLEPGALQRQHRRQRRRRTVRGATVIAVVACVVAAAGIFLASAWPLGDRSGTSPAAGSPHRPSLVRIDASSGRTSSALIQNVASDSRAAISPDGTRVAFARPFKASEQIYVTNLDGTATRLTGPGKGGCACGSSGPAWSPDGQWIAFAGMDMTAEQSIYVVNVATGELRRVTRSPGSLEADPTWSPDGRLIAFTHGSHNRQSLWIVNVANGHLSQVSTLSAENPAWSPDGRTIAFSRSSTGALESGLWLVHPDGSGLRLLANAAVESDGSVSWSPDGSEIAFAAPRSVGKPPYVDIDVVNVSTGQVRVLARGLDYPIWSAEGQSILALRP